MSNSNVTSLVPLSVTTLFTLLRCSIEYLFNQGGGVMENKTKLLVSPQKITLLYILNLENQAFLSVSTTKQNVTRSNFATKVRMRVCLDSSWCSSIWLWWTIIRKDIPATPMQNVKVHPMMTAVKELNVGAQWRNTINWLSINKGWETIYQVSKRFTSIWHFADHPA